MKVKDLKTGMVIVWKNSCGDKMNTIVLRDSVLSISGRDYTA